MDRLRTEAFICIIILLIASAFITGIYTERSNKLDSFDPHYEGIKTYIAVLEKQRNESVSEFFTRIHVTINYINQHGFIVYAFMPVFAFGTPEIIGATITYESRLNKKKQKKVNSTS